MNHIASGGSDLLVIDNDVDAPVEGMSLPAVCVKCGAREGLKPRRETLTWTHPTLHVIGLVLLFPIAVLGIAVMAVAQKKAQATFPVCGPCNSKWTNGKIVKGLAIAVAVSMLLFSPLFGQIFFGTPGLIIGYGLFILAFGGLPYLVSRFMLHPASVWAARIAGGRVLLRGCCPAFLAALGR